MILASIYEVFEDDPALVDVRVDLYFPWGNGTQWVTIPMLVNRDNLPTGYTWDDIAAACTSIVDVAGITVIAPTPMP